MMTTMDERPRLEPHSASTATTLPIVGPDQALAALHAARRAIREAQALARTSDGLSADDRTRFLDLLAADLIRLPRPDKEGVWWMWDGETWELVRVSFHCTESVCLLEFFGTDDTLELDAFPPDVQFTPAYTFRPPPLPRKAP
jgi:hypothetical protein